MSDSPEIKQYNSDKVDFYDSVFLVLGGTGGIGSSLVRILVSEGATVYFTGRDQARLVSLASETGACGIKMCIEEPGAVDEIVSMIMEKHGKLNGLANCIGSLILKPAHLTADDEWDSIITVNLKSGFLSLRAGACAMMRSGGSIVLVASAAARVGIASHEAIASAKAGLIGLAQSAAASYARRGIRVNCVSPGLVETQLTRSITGNDVSRLASQSMHALGRLGRPEDIASMIAWLLSTRSSWITGQNLGVDGGLSLVRVKPQSG